MSNDLAKRAKNIADKNKKKLGMMDCQLDRNRDESYFLRETKKEDPSVSNNKAEKNHETGREKKISKQQIRSKRQKAAETKKKSNRKRNT